MLDCPACGEENPDKAKFCSECASPLTETAPAGRREERKVVTVLFCDLVGSTALAEGQDPEDVEATLRPYHALLRGEIERYGGTVEKFIGDAVMAVFGAPVAREDDPERAVRAGLRILEAIEELNEQAGLGLAVRIGINTGEVLVRLDARPDAGEGMVSGDAVNTAARLESSAPAGAVVVGERTHEVTQAVFRYDEREPVSVKSKAEPLRTWEATAPLARFGTDLTRTHSTPLAGREVDLALMRASLDKALADRSVQLVTIVGNRGSGRAGSSPSSSATSTTVPNSSRCARGGASPTGKASRSGRSGRS